MNEELLFAAIGEIREDILLDAQAIPLRPKRRLLRQLTAACLAVLLLAVPVSAEVSTGYVSNLLAPLYGNAQTALVDSVGVPIGAETTVAGYTLSADAIIGDRYNIGIVYTLRRADGGELPEGLCFRQPNGARLLAGGGSSVIGQEMSENRRVLSIVETSESNGKLFLFRRKATAVFSDLMIRDAETGEETMWQEGFWNVSFTVRYRVNSRKFSVGNLNVVNSTGDRFTVHHVEISPVGIHMKLTVPNPGYGKEPLKEGASEEEIMSRNLKRFELSLKLKDGTAIAIEDCGQGAHGKSDEPTYKGTYRAMWDEPIPLENIAALIFCGTEYPVDFS